MDGLGTPLCTLLKTLSLCANSPILTGPAAGLAQRLVFTTRLFAQKTYAKPVGGRGKSAFPSEFFFRTHFLDAGCQIGMRLKGQVLDVVILTAGGKIKRQANFQKRLTYEAPMSCSSLLFP